MEIWYTALETLSGSFTFALYKYVWFLYIYNKSTMMWVYGMRMLCSFLQLLYLFLVSYNTKAYLSWKKGQKVDAISVTYGIVGRNLLQNILGGFL